MATAGLTAIQRRRVTDQVRMARSAFEPVKQAHSDLFDILIAHVSASTEVGTFNDVSLMGSSQRALEDLFTAAQTYDNPVRTRILGPAAPNPPPAAVAALQFIQRATAAIYGSEEEVVGGRISIDSMLYRMKTARKDIAESLNQTKFRDFRASTVTTIPGLYLDYPSLYTSLYGISYRALVEPLKQEKTRIQTEEEEEEEEALHDLELSDSALRAADAYAAAYERLVRAIIAHATYALAIPIENQIALNIVMDERDKLLRNKEHEAIAAYSNTAENLDLPISRDRRTDFTAAVKVLQEMDQKVRDAYNQAQARTRAAKEAAEAEARRERVALRKLEAEKAAAARQAREEEQRAAQHRREVTRTRQLGQAKLIATLKNLETNLRKIATEVQQRITTINTTVDTINEKAIAYSDTLLEYADSVKHLEGAPLLSDLSFWISSIHKQLQTDLKTTSKDINHAIANVQSVSATTSINPTHVTQRMATSESLDQEIRAARLLESSLTRMGNTIVAIMNERIATAYVARPDGRLDEFMGAQEGYVTWKERELRQTIKTEAVRLIEALKKAQRTDIGERLSAVFDIIERITNAKLPTKSPYGPKDRPTPRPPPSPRAELPPPSTAVSFDELFARVEGIAERIKIREAAQLLFAQPIVPSTLLLHSETRLRQDHEEITRTGWFEPTLTDDQGKTYLETIQPIRRLLLQTVLDRESDELSPLDLEALAEQVKITLSKLSTLVTSWKSLTKIPPATENTLTLLFDLVSDDKPFENRGAFNTQLDKATTTMQELNKFKINENNATHVTFENLVLPVQRVRKMLRILMSEAWRPEAPKFPATRALFTSHWKKRMRIYATFARTFEAIAALKKHTFMLTPDPLNPDPEWENVLDSATTIVLNPSTTAADAVYDALKAIDKLASGQHPDPGHKFDYVPRGSSGLDLVQKTLKLRLDPYEPGAPSPTPAQRLSLAWPAFRELAATVAKLNTAATAANTGIWEQLPSPENIDLVNNATKYREAMVSYITNTRVTRTNINKHFQNLTTELVTTLTWLSQRPDGKELKVTDLESTAKLLEPMYALLAAFNTLAYATNAYTPTQLTKIGQLAINLETKDDQLNKSSVVWPYLMTSAARTAFRDAFTNALSEIIDISDIQSSTQGLFSTHHLQQPHDSTTISPTLPSDSEAWMDWGDNWASTDPISTSPLNVATSLSHIASGTTDIPAAGPPEDDSWEDWS